MGSQARRMWRRNRKRFVHYDNKGAWYDEKTAYTACDIRVVNGIHTAEDTAQITCSRCNKWLSDQVERVLASDVEESLFYGYNRTL